MVNILKTICLLCCLLLPLEAQVKIMPMGDSITRGVADSKPSEAGYRARLFDRLTEAQANFKFIGVTTSNSNATLIAAGQQYHNGFGWWTIQNLFRNFTDNVQPHPGDANQGGFLMGGGPNHPEVIEPDMVLLLAGTNDILRQTGEPELEKRMTELLTWLLTHRPIAQVFIGTVPPCGQKKKDAAIFNPVIDTFNTWIKAHAEKLSPRFHVVDIHGIFIDASGAIKEANSPDGQYLIDGVHPSHNGYVAMGDLWFEAIKSLVLPNAAATAPTTNAPASNTTSAPASTTAPQPAAP